MYFITIHQQSNVRCIYIYTNHTFKLDFCTKLQIHVKSTHFSLAITMPFTNNNSNNNYKWVSLWGY